MSASLRSVVLVLLLALLVPVARAQESGGSFGGSSWDEPSSGGGGSDWGSGGGGSDWGSSGGSSSWEDDRAAEEARRASEEEARRREEEERRRREEEERLRREAEAARIAAERARLLALPPVLRAREVSFPETPLASALVPPDLRLPARHPGSSAAATTVSPPAELNRTAHFRGGFNWGASWCCSLGLFVAFFPLTLLLAWRRSDASQLVGDGSYEDRALQARRTIGGQARRITLAFDWTVRAGLQAELKAMSQRLDMKTRPGLHAAAVEVVLLLFQHASAARYATWELSQGDARSWFSNRQNDLRSRFQTDRVRNLGGTQLGAGSGEHVARPDEGEGLVVISILVAGKSPMPIPSGAVSAEDVAQILPTLVPRSPSEMLALEVIWSPSEELDRMSSLELERFYPELMRFGNNVGRYACTYCHAPYPRELGRCPACGAPAEPDETETP